MVTGLGKGGKPGMITKPKILKNILIAIVLIGEPALFAFPLPVSIYLLVLKESWPFQAVAAFGLLLTGMPWPYALKNGVIGALLTSEALMFSSNERAFAGILIALIFSFPVQVCIWETNAPGARLGRNPWPHLLPDRCGLYSLFSFKCHS